MRDITQGDLVVRLRRSLELALREAGIDLVVTATRELGGGCIHRVLELTLADGSRLVAKMNDGDQFSPFPLRRK